MGKRIYVQRRGRGYKFSAASHKRIAPARYLPITENELASIEVFTVVDLLHETGRISPLMKVQYEESKKETYLPAVESAYVGMKGEQGKLAGVKIGNIAPLSSIPEASYISNVELRPGDGGSLVRTAGAYATLVSKTDSHAIIKLPSGYSKKIKLHCRATVGNVAGGGVTTKPFVKAGKRRALRLSRGHSFPIVRGVAKNACDHPFGGGYKKSPKKPTTVSRNAPPGRKVGLIAARRTGLRRGKIELKKKPL